MKGEPQSHTASASSPNSDRQEAPHLLDASSAHLMQCASCRLTFRSAKETPEHLELLFGAADTPLTCLQPEEIDAYRLEQCSLLERESIEMHIADCAACRQKALSHALSCA